MATEPAESALGVWKFRDVELREASGELKIKGRTVALERKPLAVLFCLVRAEGELVSKPDLFEAVWAGRIVTDGVLTQAIKRIREVLGDTDRSLLKTIHGIGFRLDATILCETEIPAEVSLELVPGAELPHAPGWTLEGRLGSRSQHELWCARHAPSGDIRVFKFARDARAKRALKREVSINQVLRARIPDSLLLIEDWQFDEPPWHIRLPWMPAGSLAQWLQAQVEPPALRLRLELVRQVCAAIAQAHAVGILHKDIKPGNVLVDDSEGAPRIRLCDFGSGALLNSERFAAAGVTVTGFTQTMMGKDTSGTPAYLAPEIMAGHGFDERADIYALGVLLYQLACNDLRQPLAPGWERDIDDAGLREIIAAACAGRPEHRIASAEELAMRLERWRPAPALPAAPPQQRSRHARRWIMAAGLAMSLGWVAWWPGSHAPAMRVAEPGPESAAAQRVAALRFSQSVSEPAQARALSGIFDALMTDLSQLPHLDLVALDRLEQDRPQLADFQQMHARLGLDQLIRGSVQLAGQRLRLNLQIMDLKSGVSRWGQSFEGDIAELFGLQDQASRSLSRALGGGSSLPRPAALGLSTEAYADYLSVLAIAEADNYFLGSPFAYDEALDAMDRVLAQQPASVEIYLLATRLFGVAHFYSRMDFVDARSRLDQVTARLDSLGASAALRALALATVQYGLELRPDLAYATLAPHREALRNRSDFQNLLPQVAWHGGHQAESYAWFADQLKRDPLNYPALITWADRMGFGQRPSDAYALLKQAQSRFPEHPEISALAAGFAWWATGDAAYLDAAHDVSLRLTLRSTRLFEVAADAFYHRKDLPGAMQLIDQVPIPMLWTASHQVHTMPLIRAWLINAMEGPGPRMRAYAQQGLDMINAARQRSDSPGRMAIASSGLALLERRDEARALAQAALDGARGDTQINRQVANLVLITWGILGAEEQALALLRAEMDQPMNGDLCLRVSHAVRWHDLRQMPTVRAQLDAHCQDLRRERADAIRRIDENAGRVASPIHLGMAR